MSFRVESFDGFYAEVEPAASIWLPWPGRTSRWWFEVTGPPEANDENQYPTHYYTFDGGAFTLRRCFFRAEKAAFNAWHKWKEESGTPLTGVTIEGVKPTP